MISAISPSLNRRRLRVAVCPLLQNLVGTEVVRDSGSRPCPGQRPPPAREPPVPGLPCCTQCAPAARNRPPRPPVPAPVLRRPGPGTDRAGHPRVPWATRSGWPAGDRQVARRARLTRAASRIGCQCVPRRLPSCGIPGSERGGACRADLALAWRGTARGRRTNSDLYRGSGRGAVCRDRRKGAAGEDAAGAESARAGPGGRRGAFLHREPRNGHAAASCSPRAPDRQGPRMSR